MSLSEIESAVSNLSREQLSAFAQWFDEYFADAWDRKIEEDIAAGKLDAAGRQASEDLKAGRCTPL